MDVFTQNMLKSREEMFRIPLTKNRSMGITAHTVGVYGAMAAMGGIDMLSG